MNPKYYCPVCHRRIENPVWTTTIWHEVHGAIKITYYETSYTEPLCDGTCERVAVPQDFYDAFADEDIEI